MNLKVLATTQTKTCFPLTVTKPNALLRIFNKSLLEYAVESFSVQYEDISVVLLESHYSLFLNAGLAEKFKFEVIRDISQIANFTTGKIPVKDASFFYPCPSSGSSPAAPVKIEHPWDMLSCQEQFSDIIEERKQGHIENNAVVKGTVSLGKGTIVKSGAYLDGNIITGDNCVIGPNCFIRGVCSIGDNCRIGNAVEIKDSILGNNVFVSHLSYVGDSIIGDGCNLGAGFISSNLRHDSEPIVTRLLGKKIRTGRIKLGAIIGDDVHTGVHTSVYPGRKIWPGLTTLPGKIVDKDIEN